ncbi:unnamed protein product [Rotaria sordida]|uniref:Fringe-like glycosyltransferase domain-containing protein n=1 Tax=Rotaria sordida TaxID=392033 RepID=A0A815F9I3_9BILA|nr:unnamed protein product [Rotaria sordida]
MFMPFTYSSEMQLSRQFCSYCTCHGYIRRRINSLNTYLMIYFILFSIMIYYHSLTSSKTTQFDIQSSSSSSSSSSNRIMYVIRTSSKFYTTRLKYLLQTWILLVNEHVYFITDKILPNISYNHFILTEKICGHEKHAMNTLCCKTAHDFIFFHRYLTKYDWFCHFDDDQYVNINNLEKYLSTLNFNRPYYIGRNSWSKPLNRLKQPYPYPFWFATLGAGVCLSKYLVHLLEPYTRNISKFINGCLKENYHDDIYLGFLISAYLNVTLTKNIRFHSHLEKDFYKDKQKFFKIFTEQITFGFFYPYNYPNFLPNFYQSHLDRSHIRTLHCLLYPYIFECQIKIRQYLLNMTK